MPLRSKVAQVLGWVSWLPVRIFALTLFLIMRDQPVRIGQWWSKVKTGEHSVDQVLDITLSLVDRTHWHQMDDPSEPEQHGQTQWYYPVCQKILWLWVGAIALLTLALM